MVTQIRASIDLGNGLLPDNTKPRHEPVSAYQESSSVALTGGAFLQEAPSITKISLKTTAEWSIYAVLNLPIIGSDNGLTPGRRQAIIWTSARILSIRPLGTNFSEILIEIQTFQFNKMRLKMSSAKSRPFFSPSMC